MTEQVTKGNIAIIKHTDNGETQIETPEEGVVFEVLLKSSGNFDAAEKTEHDILICGENGFAQTKDMPYGIYTVHQTSEWDRRELMKDFNVFICKDSHTYRYLINNANFKSYIKVVKKDVETGKVIPYAGVGFQIYDSEGNLVTMIFTYPEVTEIDTFFTTADGELITLPISAMICGPSAGPTPDIPITNGYSGSDAAKECVSFLSAASAAETA